MNIKDYNKLLAIERSNCVYLVKYHIHNRHKEDEVYFKVGKSTNILHRMDKLRQNLRGGELSLERVNILPDVSTMCANELSIHRRLCLAGYKCNSSKLEQYIATKCPYKDNWLGLSEWYDNLDDYEISLWTENEFKKEIRVFIDNQLPAELYDL
jgi:hypothetical protein